MAKIRTVKPELFRHEELFEAEKQSGFPLRLIFIGLFTTADAKGRFRWKPKQLKLDILPYDDINFEQALETLAAFGFIVKYEHEDECYGCIPSWHKHQSINKREPDSRLPMPNMCTHVQDSALHGFEQERNMQCTETNITASDLHLEKTTTQSHSASKIIDEKTVGNTVITDDFSKEPTSISSTCNHAAHACTCMHMQNKETHMHASLEMEVEMEKELEMDMELEVEGCGKEKPKREPPDAVHVFEHWKTVMRHPRAVLDKQRKKLIRDALNMGYDVVALCKAIDGCSQTPHNMGHNDHGERYDGLHIILRSAEQIDRFIHNASHPPRPHNKAEKRVHDNLNAAQAWLAKSTEANDESSR